MNEYNSPSKLKRMREAGINPDLNGVDNGFGATNCCRLIRKGNPYGWTSLTCRMFQMSLDLS